MTPKGVVKIASSGLTLLAIAGISAVVSCGPQEATLDLEGDPYPPGLDLSKEAVDGLEVGHRLMAAAQYDLAVDAFTRAALDQGMTPEILNGLGTAYMGLGRLGQSEKLLRRAAEAAPEWPEVWNNLGVLLMERGETPEATLVFRKAYALDDGQNDSIRDNFRLALAKMENADNTVGQSEEYKLVRRGSSDFLIRKTP